MTDQRLQFGSSVVPLYVERQMKVYAITESEFASLSTLNAQMTTFASVGTALIGAAGSIWANAVFYTEVPPTATIAKSIVAPACVVLALVFFYLAWHARKNRRSTWDSIKAESSSLPSSAGSVSPAA
jgi:protein-S-isoprenylcysteine O-methyltransferase Ste14